MTDNPAICPCGSQFAYTDREITLGSARGRVYYCQKGCKYGESVADRNKRHSAKRLRLGGWIKALRGK